ncbi:MAG: hypothetical protein AB1673_08330 [Actinomycetota bacterium]
MAITPASPVCENCARDEEDLTSVWPPVNPGAEPAASQLWCPECVARFPHEPADDEG